MTLLRLLGRWLLWIFFSGECLCYSVYCSFTSDQMILCAAGVGRELVCYGIYIVCEDSTLSSLVLSIGFEYSSIAL